MKAYVINMASATDRMAFMARQLDHLGLDWTRIEAVTPDTLTPPESDPVWHRWQRPLRVTEMALCASHMAAWQAVIAADAPALVLEDDALLSPSVPVFLDRLSGVGGLDHVNLETRSRRKLVGPLRGDVPVRRLWQDRTGSAAYVAWPAGARKMLDHARRVGGPSDAIISSTYAQASFQADPALAIQLDQCRAYGIEPPVETVSLIDAVPKPPPAGGGLAFRLRRIAAQLRMGGRHLVRVGRSERVLVPPAADIAAFAAELSASAG